MSRTRNTRTTNGGRPDGRRGQQRHISVRSVRRQPPDVRKLGRAIIRMAVIEAEAERAAQSQGDTTPVESPQPEDPGAGHDE